MSCRRRWRDRYSASLAILRRGFDRGTSELGGRGIERGFHALRCFGRLHAGQQTFEFGAEVVQTAGTYFDQRFELVVGEQYSLWSIVPRYRHSAAMGGLFQDSAELIFGSRSGDLRNIDQRALAILKVKVDIIASKILLVIIANLSRLPIIPFVLFRGHRTFRGRVTEQPTEVLL